MTSVNVFSVSRSGTRPVDSDWIFCPIHRPAATTTLVCFHAAGSSPAMYRRWANQLPESVETVLIRMPGRESRLAEPPITNFDAAVAAIESALAGRLDQRYVFFGHSMGAYLAFAVAASRTDSGKQPPEQVIVSGATPPHLFRPPLGGQRRTDQYLIELLSKMGGTAPELLENEEMREIILRTYHADLSICDSLRAPTQVLTCPLWVFGGESDDITHANPQEWDRYCSSPIKIRMFPGGHFFVNTESEGKVLAELTRVLSGQHGD